MVERTTPRGNVDLDSASSWLAILHGGAAGLLHICSTKNWSGQTFTADQHDSALSYISFLDNGGAQGIYLRVTTLNRPLAAGERGSDADSRSFPGMWADIDIAGPGHKTTKPLPPSVEEAMRIVSESGLPEPTMWIHSGGGLYPWWLLDAPITLDSTTAEGHASVESTQAISARWQDVLAATAERIGYSYGPVGDLSRVMRIPGTVNRKIPGDPRPCVFLNEHTTGRTYSPHQLGEYLSRAEQRVQELSPKPAPVAPQIPRPRPPADRGDSGPGGRPGDDLAAQMSWEEILEPHGYQFDRTHGVETYWVRPGKHRRDGHSCTTNYQGSDLMWVFSTEMAGFESNRSYSKFATWAILNGYGEDFKAASKALRAQGFGSQRQAATPPQPSQLREVADGGGDAGAAEGDPASAVVVVPQVHDYEFTDLGAAELMAALYGNAFRYVPFQSEWLHWDGEVWRVDDTSAVHRAAAATTKFIVEQGMLYQNAPDSGHDANAAEAGKPCRCLGCVTIKHGRACQGGGRMKNIVTMFGQQLGISASPHAFDVARTLVTVDNGVLDLSTGLVKPFDSRDMLTRRVNAKADLAATAPKFRAFLEQVLPSAEVRDYVQRAVGYSLTGDNDQRVLFLLHGPSGTGKSQFLSILERLFGDFGGTAESTTFQVTRSEATNNLHSLRSKRFVTTSETSDSAKLNEELIKRLTGGDFVTTRELYQRNVTWRPEFVIWMATNFPPRMNSDDGAVWARYKPIHFGVQFTREDGSAVPNIGRTIFEEESAGILNWVLEGVAMYRRHGLGEPKEVREAVTEHRLESDNVAQFLADSIEEGRLIKDPEARELRSSTLYRAYVDWCVNERTHPLGQKRFTQRMTTLGYERIRSNGAVWLGLRFSPVAGILGSMG